jgi:hypothetical protein
VGVDITLVLLVGVKLPAFVKSSRQDGDQGCQMVYLQTKNPNFYTFLGPRTIHFWYILIPFGVFYGDLVDFVVIWLIFFHFGIFVPRKIWQPRWQQKTSGFNARTTNVLWEFNLIR